MGSWTNDSYETEAGHCRHCIIKARMATIRGGKRIWYPICSSCISDGHLKDYMIPYKPTQGLCMNCGISFQKEIRSKLYTTYDSLCHGCRSQKTRCDGNLIKKEVCSSCGSTEIHRLEVDHIDGNPNNNDKDNLQVLCSDCHKAKTKRNRDFIGTK